MYRRNMIGLGESVGDHLPVRFEMRDVEDRGAGILVRDTRVTIPELAQKLRERYLRLALEVDEDPALPDARGNRRQAIAALVEAKEVTLVRDTKKRTVVAVSPVVIATNEAARAPLAVQHERVRAMRTNIIESPDGPILGARHKHRSLCDLDRLHEIVTWLGKTFDPPQAKPGTFEDALALQFEIGGRTIGLG